MVRGRRQAAAWPQAQRLQSWRDVADSGWRTVSDFKVLGLVSWTAASRCTGDTGREQNSRLRRSQAKPCFSPGLGTSLLCGQRGALTSLDTWCSV